jgi:LAO/AO transport system kinase
MSLADAILAGDARALARAATLIETQTESGRELSQRLFPSTGRALSIGVTGAPGAGKSTLVNNLIGAFRSTGKTVGVVAVDPSSPYSHGALLGDRVRMLEHHADAGVFIRSMATRGRLGGLAATTMDLVLLLDAAGRDVILIETVGVGQDELDVAHLADVTIVVLAPGAGDDIQALKAGILEVANIIAINKADLPGADRLREEILESQRLRDSGARPEAPVCKTSSVNQEGIPELLLLIQAVAQSKKALGANADVWAHRLRQKLRDDLLADLPAEMLAKHARRVSEKIEDPDSAIMALKAELLDARENVIEIDHLGIAVRSLNDELCFYRDVLGMTVADRETVEAERVNVAMLPAGDSSRIELLEATDDDSAIARFIAKRGPGLHHLAVKVDDLDGTVERLRQRGARLLNEPRAGAGGHIYVFVHPESTGGVLLELIQR